MIHLWTLLISVAAFAALAFAMDRHQEDLFGRALSARVTRLLRILGWTGLLLALWVIVGRQGWGLGLVSYSGCTSLAAGLVFLALVVHDRRRA
ncbi:MULTISPECIES: DUF3325 domain-containing protein [unclassified Achromobacter]|uniref:DUF3325 domain-containing protein n=1 Tax=unclassified Achromobacter TaxID=2626865 RepID=UPI000B51C840|nr:MULTISPECIES: DUF3325 domain-containing protein [unclassified Achromobacter]OWT73560.1 hypothetical protein CEY05_20825 [Achromobacter sp. HZ34]OWT79522.1 hypothetical protein CEY04_11155 [Achromobacter sp. HZ28]